MSGQKLLIALLVPKRTSRAAFVQCLVIHMGAGGAVLLSLDGEGVFESFHPGLQILDFSLLLFQGQRVGVFLLHI